MNYRSLRASGAIVAAAALLLTMAWVTPATAAKTPPEIRFCSSTYEVTEGENYDATSGQGHVTVDLCRKVKKGSPSVGVLAGVGSGDTATSGWDYTSSWTPVSFSARQTTVSFDVPINIDFPGESDETFTIELQYAGSDWTVGSDATVTIHQMPAPPAPTLDLVYGTGSPTMLNWSWQLDGWPHGPVTFQLWRNEMPLGWAGRENGWYQVHPVYDSTADLQWSELVGWVPFGPYWYAAKALNAEGVSGPFSGEIDVLVGDWP